MIASSTTASARAAVAADWTAIESKLRDVKRDLGTPAMRDMFSKTGKATWTAQKAEAKIGAALMLVATLKSSGIGGLVGGVSAFSSLVSAADDLADLPRQIHEALGAARSAHPDAVVLERDLRDLAGAVKKLVSDAPGVMGF